MKENKDTHMELAVRIPIEDWKALSDEIHKNMWVEGKTVHLEFDAEVLAFGRDGFISEKLEEDE